LCYKTWSGIENKPDGNFCENDSFVKSLFIKFAGINIETGAPFCKASVWYGSNPKPDNECEDNSGCTTNFNKWTHIKLAEFLIGQSFLEIKHYTAKRQIGLEKNLKMNVQL